MIRYFISLFLLAITLSLHAQEEPVATKAVFMELGGPGAIMSANFDGRFKADSRLGWGYRVGAGFAVREFDDQPVHNQNGELAYYTGVKRTVYTFPVGVSYILGKEGKKSSFEVGGGVTLLSRKTTLFYYEAQTEGHVLGYLTFMFRLAPIRSGMLFRAGFTPIIGTGGDLYPMVGVGFGYAF